MLLDLILVDNLEILEVSLITSSVEPIGKFTNLKQLYLNWNNYQYEVTDLSFLANLFNLEKLELDSGIITDIEPIK